jgi:hypothetical protein
MFEETPRITNIHKNMNSRELESTKSHPAQECTSENTEIFGDTQKVFLEIMTALPMNDMTRSCERSVPSESTHENE